MYLPWLEKQEMQFPLPLDFFTESLPMNLLSELFSSYFHTKFLQHFFYFPNHETVTFWDITLGTYYSVIIFGTLLNKMPSFTTPPVILPYCHLFMHDYCHSIPTLLVLNEKSPFWRMYSLLLGVYNLYTFPHNESKTILIRYNMGQGYSMSFH